MRSSRIVSAIVLALVCVFVGGGLSLASAEPTNNFGMLKSGGLTRAVSTKDGFTLDPNRGTIGTSVKITPPKSDVGNSGSTGEFQQVDAFGDFAVALGADGLIYAWGDNSYGELGIGVSGGNRNTPQLAKTPAGVRFTQIGAGQWHAIALDTKGNVWTWGRGNVGQLGIPDNLRDQNTPQMVPGPDGKPNSNKFQKVSAGGKHSAALDNSGQIWSWGENQRGQLGLGYKSAVESKMMKTKPFIFGGTEYKAKDVDCGGEHTLARDQDGYLWSWGRNQEQQLGIEDSTDDKDTPQGFRREGRAGVDQIAAGGFHSEIISAGFATGFGSNQYAQSGNAYQFHYDGSWRDPNARGYNLQTRVPFTTKKVLDDNHFVWLPDPYGHVIYVSAGYYHSLGIAQDGALENPNSPFLVWGWGHSSKSELGFTGYTDYEHNIMAFPYPSDKASAKNFRVLAAGKYFSVGITHKTNRLYAWGANDQGQLGDGTNISTNAKREEPQPIATVSAQQRPLEIVEVKFDGVNAPKKSVDASSGAWNVDAPKPNQAIGTNDLTVDVKVTYKDANGNNATTTLKYTYAGNNSPVDPNPTPPPAGSCTVSFYLSGAPGAIPSQTIPCGTRAKWPGDANPKWSGRWFNGWAVQGGLRYPDDEHWDFNKPVTKNMTLEAKWQERSFNIAPNKGSVEGSTVKLTRNPGERQIRFLSVSAGKGHTLAVGSDGYLYSWGKNDNGQLGDGTTLDRSEPVRVKTPDDLRFLQVSAGGGHSLALDSTGEVWGWGKGNRGQIGNQNTANSTEPVKINRMETGNVKFKEVSAGGEHSLALDTNGDAWSWGSHDDGILGLGDSIIADEWHPKRIPGGIKFDTLSAGYHHSAGVDLNGEVWSWGNNKSGQLGIENTTNQSRPVKIVRKVNTKPGEDSTGVKFRSISAGNDFTVALADNGSAWAWGENGSGQIGNNWNVDEWHPIKVHPDKQGKEHAYKKVSAGGCHVVALDSADWPYTWGCNDNGRLGIEDIPSTPQWEPTQIGLGYSRDISVGDVHSAAVVYSNGAGLGQRIQTWGDASPQLGRGDSVKNPRLGGNIIRPLVDLTSIKFGSQLAQSIIISERTDDQVTWELQAPPAPASSPGPVDVTIQWTLGDDDVLKNKYLYYDK